MRADGGAGAGGGGRGGGDDIVSLSATGPGRALAERLPYRHVQGDVGGSLRREWEQVDGFVVMLAVGATVRLLAPLLADKASDPCVVCVDDAGRYVVVLVGGHAGGGNILAEAVAARLGAEAVVTTATDRLGIPALDGLPGLKAEGDVAAVTTALIDGEPVELRNDVGWPVPEALAARCTGTPGSATVVVSDATAPSGGGSVVPVAGVPVAGVPVVRLRPPTLVVGVGTSSDATADELTAAVAESLAAAGLSAAAVGTVATVYRRADHPAVVATANAMGVPVTAFPAEVLDTVPVPAPSDVVRRAVGTRSVAEAAAIAASGRSGCLVAGKRRFDRVTVAVGRRGRPVGRVTVVGLGPGSPEHRTPAAERAVRWADVVVGLSTYVDQCRDLLDPAKRVRAFPLGAEIERARAALAEAEDGNRVALVCSGDAGIYAMASPLLQLPESAAVPVDVVPGITAGTAAAALLGAPLGHDHAVVSLSDLHTPWPVIEARLRAAAEADFAVVLYNPRSARRTWQLEAARTILLSCRPETTPVGVVTDGGRPGEKVVLTTLGAFDAGDVTMTTCLVVGSRRTRIVGGRMVTPRGYLTAP